MRYLLIVLLSLISFTASAQPFQVVASCGTVSNPGAIGSGMNGYIDTSGNICTNASASNLNGANASGAVVTATGATTARTGADRAADLINVKDGYGGQAGAKGDGQLVSATVTIGSGSTGLTVGSGIFSSADVGKSIVVGNAGTAPTKGLPESIPVATAGSGYTSVPTCSITDTSGSGTGATCSALMSAVSATVVSGGTGCANGSAVEFVVSIDGQGSGTGAGTIPRFTGAVSGGVLSGALTLTVPGIQTVLGTITAAPAYGDNCATAPTITLSYGVGAVQITSVGAAVSLPNAVYSTTQTTAALSGGSPSVAATLGAVNVAAPTPPLSTTIATYVSPTQITLASPALSAVSGAVMLLWATDDHVAFQNAINAGLGIMIPKGIYWMGANSLNPGTSNLTVMGSGRDNTILAFDNGNTTSQDSPTPGAWTPLFKHATSQCVPWVGELTFQDFQVRGLLDFGRVDIGAAAMELYNYKRVTQQNMIFRQLPWMANQNQCNGQYEVTGTFFDTVTRDQARCRQCFAVRIIGNKFLHSDDDSVAIHQVSTPIGPSQIGEGVVVTDNDFEDTLCIHILGARSVVVRGNTGRRCKVQAVNLSWTPPPAGEGTTQLRSLILADNSFNDTTTRNGSATAAAVYNVSFSGPLAATGITSMIPGTSATANFFPKPWDYDHGSILAGQFVPAARGVDIHDNIAMRTQNAVTAYSLWGAGQMFTAAGFVDVPVPDSMLQPTAGISASVNTPDLRIHDNHIHDVRRGIVINDVVVSANQVNVSITGNDIFNSWEYGIYGAGSGQFSSFDIINNTIMVDPYLISPGRSGGTGGWSNNYGASVGVLMNYVGPVKMALNTMAEMYQTQQPLASWVVWQNTLRGAPFSGTTGQLTGWTSANFGIGVYPVNGGDMFDIQAVTSNTVSGPAGYGLRQASKTKFSATAPSSGFHVIGDRIISTDYVSCTCTYWLALTTGTAWTAGTDYVAK